MACVYIIRHKNSNDCYIGSTNDFKHRRWNHISDSNNEKSRHYNYKLYKFIRENGGWDNFDMVKVCDCEEEERNKMEQYHIDFIKPSLNSYNVILDREAKKEKQRLHRRKKYKEKGKIWNEERKKQRYTCECGSELRWVDKVRHNATLKHQRFLASSSC